MRRVRGSAAELELATASGSVRSRQALLATSAFDPGSVGNEIRALWKDKLLHADDDKNVVLTKQGMKAALAAAQDHLD